MPDHEMRWIPDRAATDRAQQRRAMSAAMLAVSCLAMGIALGWLAAGGIPHTALATRSAVPAPPDPLASAPSVGAEIGRSHPSVLGEPQSDRAQPTAEQNRATSPPPPRVVLLNPGTADPVKIARPSPINMQEQTAPGYRSPNLRIGSVQEGPTSDLSNNPRDDLKRDKNVKTRDYHSLREYMFRQ
jgi:hypothetical protein